MLNFIDKILGIYEKQFKIVLTVFAGIVGAIYLSNAIYVACTGSTPGYIVGTMLKDLLIIGLCAIPAVGAWLKKDVLVKVGLTVVLGNIIYNGIVNISSNWSNLSYFSSYTYVGTKIYVLAIFFSALGFGTWAVCSFLNYLMPKQLFKIIVVIAGLATAGFMFFGFVGQVVEWIESGSGNEIYYVLVALLNVAYYAAITGLPLVFKLGENKEETVDEEMEETAQIID